MAKIVVTRPLPRAAIDRLAEVGEAWMPTDPTPLARDALLSRVADANALLAFGERVDAELLASAPGLRIVANVSAGYDNLDLAALAAAGVTATNTPGVLVDATADLALGLLLGITRRLAEGDRLVRSAAPWSFRFDFMLGSGLRGKQLGIVGLGRIGQGMADRCRALGMTIAHAGRREVEGSTLMGLNELLATSDVVTLHCPLTAETRHLIDAAALARMKPTAYLINTARGPVVDESALVDALRSGTIAGAGLDVYEDEPRVHPGLLDLDTVMLTPHLGSATVETRLAMAQLAVDNVIAVLQGREPVTPIPQPA